MLISQLCLYFLATAIAKYLNNLSLYVAGYSAWCMIWLNCLTYYTSMVVLVCVDYIHTGCVRLLITVWHAPLNPVKLHTVFICPHIARFALLVS